jgi:hypothetical protein
MAGDGVNGMLLHYVANAPFVVWFLCTALCRAARSYGRDPGILRTVRNELHPFRWAFAVGIFIVGTVRHGTDVGPGILLAIDLYWCWLYRKDNDDDNRWKRRLDTATGYVREVAGRLTVVPEPA